ncbi:MAG: cytochrome-c peroxidase [Bacteroidota bacterium]
MKKQFIVTLIVIITLTIPFLNFKYKESDESLLTVQQQFHIGLTNFEQSIAHFNELAQNFDASEAYIQKLQEAHLNNRLAFKQIELFLEYYERFAVVKNLNGAPLPKTEPAVAEVLIVNPTGLQVLDELVFAEHPYEERKEIQKHAMKLVGSYKEIKDYQMEVAMTHRHIFEAARQELVRIFTLGVTGFDTPGSVNALPEAAVAMQSIAEAIHAYYPLIENKNLTLVKEVQNTFEEAISYLNTNNDFDSFDRLTFLKKYINPLYKSLYEFHLATGVETVDEVNPQPLPFNYEATNIFGNDFLNVEYFAQLDLDHELSEERIELGKLLFFDPILSSTNDRSCASCHRPEKAFTDGLKTSLATGNQGNVQRNAPTIMNAVYADKYFYDLRGLTLEKQSKHVIFDEKEFDTNFKEILGKIEQSQEYQSLFKSAYSDHPKYSLSAATITNALAYYVASLRSFNSPFDQYVRNEREDLSPSAKNGFNLFMGKAACGTCHFAPTFNGSVPPIYEESESEILGVPATAENKELDSDIGRVGNQFPRDEAPFYIHSFKTVTVRNAAMTAPYMHNGVYETL